MIGDRFIKFLRPSPPRSTPKLDLFMNFLDQKINDGYRRATYSPFNTNGIRLLVEIIKLSNIETLLSMSDSKRNIGEYLLSILPELEKPIDIRTGKRNPQGLFIKTKSSCFELVTPSRRQNPLYEVPIGQKYDHPQWEKIQPFRIVEMGDADLTFKVFESRLDYYRKGPNHVIYTLDCFSLICKFIAYYKSLSKKIDIDEDIRTFLHNEIIVHTLLNDSVSLWLRNTYRRQFISDSPLESHMTTNWDNVSEDTLGSDFTAAMADIVHLKDDLKSGGISPLTVLSTLPMNTRKDNFIKYYTDLFYSARLPYQQSYIWVDCLKNMGWWEFIILISSFTNGYPDVISFQRDLVRDIRFWIMMKPWNEIHSSFKYRDVLRHKLEALYHYLKTL